MRSGLSFGTSGIRGLAKDLIGSEARRYVSAFLRVLQQRGEPIPALYLGCDFRESSPQIIKDCAAAAAELGITPIFCGMLPTPALAGHAIVAGAPSVMVTGSHIPKDRNGLKFYTRDGEISKTDEAAIIIALEPATPGNYDAPIRDEASLAQSRYVGRYASFLPPQALAGFRIGVYQHSSVARDLLVIILSSFGAEVIGLGRIDGFVAVDTEAFSDAVLEPLGGWVHEHRLDAIMSADGDADRPLLMDSKGRFVRGDILGLLTARFIGAEGLVTPVTSNTAIEASGYFMDVRRTRVGSPYVVEAMFDAIAEGNRRVIGFEANGGTLLGNDLTGSPRLNRLMTRDAVLPLLGTIGLAVRVGQSIADLVDGLPLRSALSGRLENTPLAASSAFLEHLRTPDGAVQFFSPNCILRSAEIDGIQFWLGNGTMIHYRASGNAPELRCYVEADSLHVAEATLKWGLDAAQDSIKNHA